MIWLKLRRLLAWMGKTILENINDPHTIIITEEEKRRECRDKTRDGDCRTRREDRLC